MALPPHALAVKSDVRGNRERERERASYCCIGTSSAKVGASVSGSVKVYHMDKALLLRLSLETQHTTCTQLMSRRPSKGEYFVNVEIEVRGS